MKRSDTFIQHDEALESFIYTKDRDALGMRVLHATDVPMDIAQKYYNQFGDGYFACDTSALVGYNRTPESETYYVVVRDGDRRVHPVDEDDSIGIYDYLTDKVMSYTKYRLAAYIASYIKGELVRNPHMKVDPDLIVNAIEAYEGGA